MPPLKEKTVAPGQGKNLNVLGDNQFIKYSGEDTKGQFALIEQVNLAGIAVPMHTHSNEDELFYILEGEIEFTLADRTFIASQGTTVYLPKGVPHGFKTVAAKNRVTVTAIPAGIEKMFQKLNNLPDSPPDMGKVLNICAEFGVKFV